MIAMIAAAMPMSSPMRPPVKTNSAATAMQSVIRTGDALFKTLAC